MKNQLENLKNQIIEDINSAKSLENLEVVYNNHFSKKGSLSQMMGNLRNLSPEERPAFGKLVNDTKEVVLSHFHLKKEELETAHLNQKLESEKINIHLPGDNLKSGSIHPLNLIIEDISQFFIENGYEVVTGPEVELDLYNFEMMNLPVGHPAREMQDSFYFDPNVLLRTHTSPVQARTMLAKEGKPLKIICPGKTYRRDEDDQTHSHQFMQIEGLVVGENISFANLKQTLQDMLNFLFKGEAKMRLRPSYFPFTEPSIEVDVLFTKKDGTKQYIEILGAGMVHPNVLKMGGYDPNIFSGFAFGIGVERLAMLRYQIEDVRHFYTNDIRFLKQFTEEF
ncbi:MAG TPA: phenylalanine--tRNA ligase subunit alpha [Acholeplasmataceae bacterium]|nr:phenylalanine--tRNA ligase subunit alpha [Acholeplasmataceae bacterium]